MAFACLVQYDYGPRPVGLAHFLPANSAAVDLRSLPEQAMGARSSGVAFALTGQAVGDVLADSDDLASRATSRMKSAWKRLLRHDPQGDTILELIWDHLTAGADPRGENACCPLMPSAQRKLELRMGAGHTAGLAPHWNKIRDVERNHVEELFRLTERNEMVEADIRRHLDTLANKYGIDKPEEQFTPAGREKLPRLPHGTTLFETWPTDGAITSSQNLAWLLDIGTISVSGGQAVGAAAEWQVARMTYSFPSDHYSQLQVTTVGQYCGPIIRKAASSTRTYYAYHSSATPSNLYKLVSGTSTDLGATANVSTNDIIKVDAVGSTITALKNGVLTRQVTDTAIPSNLQTGIAHYNSTAKSDNFQAGDGLVTLSDSPIWFM